MSDAALAEALDAMRRLAEAMTKTTAEQARVFVELEDIREGMAELDAKVARLSVVVGNGVPGLMAFDWERGNVFARRPDVDGWHVLDDVADYQRKVRRLRDDLHSRRVDG